MKRKTRRILSLVLIFALVLSSAPQGFTGHKVFAANEKCKAGWVKLSNGGTGYRYNTGRYAKGWKTIRGDRYYFKSNRARATGMNTIKNKKYYFYKNGKLSKNKMHKNGYSDSKGVYKKNKWIKFSDGKYGYKLGNGKYARGWRNIGDYRYYFGKDKRRFTGMRTISGKTCYFYKNGKLSRKQMHKNGYSDSKGIYTKHKWVKFSDGKYGYKLGNGKYARGWRDISDYSYYFGSNNRRYTGLKKIDGKTYFFYNNGRLSKNKMHKNGYSDSKGVYIKHKWVKFSDGKYGYKLGNGEYASGWRDISDYSYYFGSNSRRYTGLKEIDGKTYFFYDNGRLSKNKMHKNGYSDNKGVYTRNKWIESEEGKMYLYGDGHYAEGLSDIGEHTYYFADGIMQTGWNSVNGKMMYFNEEGVYLPDAEEHISKPEEKKVWVVDKKAWEEEKQDILNAVTYQRWIIYFRDGTYRIYEDEMEWDYDTTYAPDVSSYGTYLPRWECPMMTVLHEDEGHYEYNNLVPKEGYEPVWVTDQEASVEFREIPGQPEKIRVQRYFVDTIDGLHFEFDNVEDFEACKKTYQGNIKDANTMFENVPTGKNMTEPVYHGEKGHWEYKEV